MQRVAQVRQRQLILAVVVTTTGLCVYVCVCVVGVLWPNVYRYRLICALTVTTEYMYFVLSRGSMLK